MKKMNLTIPDKWLITDSLKQYLLSEIGTAVFEGKGKKYVG